MQALIPIAPALLLAFAFLLGMPVFAVRVRRFGWADIAGAQRREATPLATPFLIRYVLWLVSPTERMLARLGVSPNAVTLASFFLGVLAGILFALDHLAVGTWAYLFSGILDVIDGRIARRLGSSSPAGALLDSVADRWGEFFALSGLAIRLRHSPGLVAVLILIAGSQMVSYTRARGEALGIELKSGGMQRAERMVLTSIVLLVAAVAGTLTPNVEPLLGSGLLIVGVMAVATSMRRLFDGVMALRRP